VPLAACRPIPIRATTSRSRANEDDRDLAKEPKMRTAETMVTPLRYKPSACVARRATDAARRGEADPAGDIGSAAGKPRERSSPSRSCTQLVKRAAGVGSHAGFEDPSIEDLAVAVGRYTLAACLCVVGAEVPHATRAGVVPGVHRRAVVVGVGGPRSDNCFGCHRAVEVGAIGGATGS